MNASRYPIPAATNRVEIKVVNSRFIATIGEAQTVEAARYFIAGIRAEFPDATHHVYAFKVGYGSAVTEGMSDDGEPAGTAGRPGLSVIRGADIGDVVLVITRYFGGRKLGTGGLVRAYTQAAQEALAALPRAERVELQEGILAAPYALYEPVKALIAAEGGTITEETFAGDVTITMQLATDEMQSFEAALAELSAGQIEITWD